MTETFEIVLINETGRANLIDWLTGVLKDGDLFAERIADDLISKFDGSDPGRTHTVEVRGHYTISGNPQTYSFDTDELDTVELDEFGAEIGRY